MSRQKKEKIFHVGSLNIQAGLSTHSYKDYLTKSWHHVSPLAKSKNKNILDIAQLVNHLDIFGVQELDPGSVRSGFSNQASNMALHAGFDHYAYQANRSTGLSVTANGLFSKHPFESLHNEKLPSRKSAVSPRGVLIAKISMGDMPKFDLAIAVAHLSLNSFDREKQVERIVSLLKEEENVILMGDFNDDPLSKSLKCLKNNMDGHTTGCTFPRWNPSKCLDSIWWRGVDVLSENIQTWGASDHCGVDIKFKAKK